MSLLTNQTIKPIFEEMGEVQTMGSHYNNDYDAGFNADVDTEKFGNLINVILWKDSIPIYMGIPQL